jgi:hypothetical protein
LNFEFWMGRRGFFNRRDAKAAEGVRSRDDGWFPGGKVAARCQCSRVCGETGCMSLRRQKVKWADRAGAALPADGERARSETLRQRSGARRAQPLSGRLSRSLNDDAKSLI